METKFQTSFIPKKPVVSTIGGISAPPKKHHTSSLFMTLATLLFIASLAGAGGAYLWDQYLTNDQNTLKQDLATREQQFNVSLIEQLNAESVKINLAEQLLQNHLAMSEIFPIISTLTSSDVRFLSMDLSAPSAGQSGITLSMQGYGTNFSAVAFQSDVLNELDQYGLRTIVKNPILSDPTLGENGTVSFGFTATIDPSSLSYEKSVSPAAPSSSPASATSTPQTP